VQGAHKVGHCELILMIVNGRPERASIGLEGELSAIHATSWRQRAVLSDPFAVHGWQAHGVDAPPSHFHFGSFRVAAERHAGSFMADDGRDEVATETSAFGLGDEPAAEAMEVDQGTPMSLNPVLHSALAAIRRELVACFEPGFTSAPDPTHPTNGHATRVRAQGCALRPAEVSQ